MSRNQRTQISSRSHYKPAEKFRKKEEPEEWEDHFDKGEDERFPQETTRGCKHERNAPFSSERGSHGPRNHERTNVRGRSGKYRPRGTGYEKPLSSEEDYDGPERDYDDSGEVNDWKESQNWEKKKWEKDSHQKGNIRDRWKEREGWMEEESERENESWERRADGYEHGKKRSGRLHEHKRGQYEYEEKSSQSKYGVKRNQWEYESPEDDRNEAEGLKRSGSRFPEFSEEAWSHSKESWDSIEEEVDRKPMKHESSKSREGQLEKRQGNPSGKGNSNSKPRKEYYTRNKYVPVHHDERETEDDERKERSQSQRTNNKEPERGNQAKREEQNEEINQRGGAPHQIQQKSQSSVPMKEKQTRPKEHFKEHVPTAQKGPEELVHYVKKDSSSLPKKSIELARSDFGHRVEYVLKEPAKGQSGNTKPNQEKNSDYDSREEDERRPVVVVDRKKEEPTQKDQRTLGERTESPPLLQKISPDPSEARNQQEDWPRRNSQIQNEATWGQKTEMRPPAPVRVGKVIFVPKNSTEAEKNTINKQEEQAVSSENFLIKTLNEYAGNQEGKQGRDQRKEVHASQTGSPNHSQSHHPYVNQPKKSKKRENSESFSSSMNRVPNKTIMGAVSQNQEQFRGKSQMESIFGGAKMMSKEAVSQYIISGGINIESSVFCQMNSSSKISQEAFLRNETKGHIPIFEKPYFPETQRMKRGYLWHSSKIAWEPNYQRNNANEATGLLELYGTKEQNENEQLEESSSKSDLKKVSLISKIKEGANHKQTPTNIIQDPMKPKGKQPSFLSFETKRNPELFDFDEGPWAQKEAPKKSMLQVIQKTKKKAEDQLKTPLSISASPITEVESRAMESYPNPPGVHPKTGFFPYKSFVEIQKGLENQTVFEGRIRFRQGKLPVIENSCLPFKIQVPDRLFNRALNKSIVYFELICPRSVPPLNPQPGDPQIHSSKAQVVGIKHSDAAEYPVALRLEASQENDFQNSKYFIGRPLFDKGVPQVLNAGNPFQKISFIEDPEQPFSSYSPQTIFIGALQEWTIDQMNPSVKLLSVVPGETIFERQYNAALMQFQKINQIEPFRKESIDSLLRFLSLNSEEAKEETPGEFRFPEAEIAKRRDLRGKMVFVVGPRPTGEFDNAISFEQVEMDRVEVGIHVSDLAYFCQKCPEFENDIRGIGTTICSAVAVCPMLPTLFLDSPWSLCPGRTSPAFTVQAHFDLEGALLSQPVVFPSCIKPVCLLSQKVMQEILEQNHFSREFEGILRKKMRIPEKEGMSLKNFFKTLHFIQKVTGVLKFNREISPDGNLDILKHVPEDKIEVLFLAWSPRNAFYCHSVGSEC